MKYETDKNLYEKNKNFIESLKVPNYKSVESNENIENSNSLKIYKLKDLYSKIKKNLHRNDLFNYKKMGWHRLNDYSIR